MRITILILFLALPIFAQSDPEKIRQLEEKVTALEGLLKNDTIGVRERHLNNRIFKLEKNAEIYNEFLQTLEGTLSSLASTLTFISIVATVLAICVSVFQAIQYFRGERKEAIALQRTQQNEERVLNHIRESNESLSKNQGENTKEILKSHQTFIEGLQERQDKALIRQEENNKNLMDAVRTNISETTALITSYKDLISLQQVAHELKSDRERAVEALKIEQKRINALAIEGVYDVFEKERESIYSNYWKGSFEAFSDDANLFIQETKLHRFKTDLNADTYFLMGLHLFLSGGLAQKAERYFELAIGTAKKCFDQQINLDEKAALFPEDSRKFYDKLGNIEAWSKAIAARCSFFIGLTYYRLENYKAAGNHFEETKKYVEKEIDAWFFYFQSKYWGEISTSLGEIISKMQEFGVEIEKIWSEKGEDTTKILKARLHMKMGDFLSPVGKLGKYDEEKNAAESFSHYGNAYNIVDSLKVNIDDMPKGLGHVVPMVYFTYGRAIKSLGDPNRHSEWIDLFTKAENFCQKYDMDIENPETKYLLFYIQAKCQKEIGRIDEARESIRKAQENFKDYCSNPSFYGYSPIKNQMLKRNELDEELKVFNRSLV